MEYDDTEPCRCNLATIQLDGYSTIEAVTHPSISAAPLYWQCPGCGTRWHRYDEGHPLRELAEPYVSAAVIREQAR